MGASRRRGGSGGETGMICDQRCACVVEHMPFVDWIYNRYSAEYIHTEDRYGYREGSVKGCVMLTNKHEWFTPYTKYDEITTRKKERTRKKGRAKDQKSHLQPD